MITRQAILISSPGGSPHPLTSDKDIRNLRHFMTSPRGGEWHSEEIIMLDNPGWWQIKHLLDRCNADYLFVYFGGHGCSDEFERRYILLKDCLVEDTALLNHTAKQLIISDSCRVYYPAISGISPGDDEYSGFAGSGSRQVFDDAIAKSEPGKMIIHATRHNDEAAEELHGRGGAFTLSLLYSALNFKTGVDLCPVTIEHLLPIVKKMLESQNYTQVPEIAFETGSLKAPFVIDTEQITKKAHGRNLNDYQRPKEHKPSLLGVMAIALIIGGFLSD